MPGDCSSSWASISNHSAQAEGHIPVCAPRPLVPIPRSPSVCHQASAGIDDAFLENGGFDSAALTACPEVAPVWGGGKLRGEGNPGNRDVAVGASICKGTPEPGCPERNRAEDMTVLPCFEGLLNPSLNRDDSKPDSSLPRLVTEHILSLLEEQAQHFGDGGAEMPGELTAAQVLALQEHHLKIRSALTFLQTITKGSSNDSRQDLHSGAKRKAPSTSGSENGATLSGIEERQETLAFMGCLETDGILESSALRATKRSNTGCGGPRSAIGKQAAIRAASSDCPESIVGARQMEAMEAPEGADSESRELVGAWAAWAERAQQAERADWAEPAEPAEPSIETLAELAEWGCTDGSEPWATRMGQPEKAVEELPWGLHWREAMRRDGWDGSDLISYAQEPLSPCPLGDVLQAAPKGMLQMIPPVQSVTSPGPRIDDILELPMRGSSVA
jgi:hypothetical protein